MGAESRLGRIRQAFARFLFLDSSQRTFKTEEERAQDLLRRIPTLQENILFPNFRPLYLLDHKGRPSRNSLYGDRALQTALTNSGVTRHEIPTVLATIQELEQALGHHEGAGPATIGDARVWAKEYPNMPHVSIDPNSLIGQIAQKLFS